MNFLTRFFKSRPDLKEGFEDSNSKEHFAAIIQPLFSEVGIIRAYIVTYVANKCGFYGVSTFSTILFMNVHIMSKEIIF